MYVSGDTTQRHSYNTSNYPTLASARNDSFKMWTREFLKFLLIVKCRPPAYITFEFGLNFLFTAVSKLHMTKTRIVKLREREGQRVDLGRSLKGHLWMVNGGWWMVVYMFMQ